MTLEEAIVKYKLDRRRRWFAWQGEAVYDFSYKQQCTGCDGGGCRECGYTGQCWSGCPVPALDENTEPIKITDKDGTKAVRPFRKGLAKNERDRGKC